MKRFMRNAGTLCAVAVASIGMTVLPAVSAQAAPAPICPAVVGVCTWTEAAYEGNLRLLFDEEPAVVPPVQSVSNQDFQPWCFYERPFFDAGGKKREVAGGQAVKDLGFAAHSAQQGRCQDA
ncbi:hypothetical protein [Streptomyces sp. NBC_01438]|uniref:hypothetical protein n=1 Tax=Streptomyces sp. NBC_01438 TaxID=2903866 RepID=UPI003249E807